MARAGLGFQFLDRIFLTHFHPDHTLDLIHFLFAKKILSKSRKIKPVVIAGPSGLKVFSDRILKAYGSCLDLPEDIITMEEFEPKKGLEMDCESFKISVQSTNHTIESCAYRVEDRKGKSAVFSGDTGFCTEIIELAGGTDLLILECSFPDSNPTEGHLTPTLAGKVAQLANAKRLVLTHFYPECLATDIASQCRKTFKGELTLACDLLQIRL
jgi:ribonuclease BN (tRNA processing enzyme)